MNKQERLIVFLFIFTVFLCGCKTQSASVKEQIPLPTATPKAEADPSYSKKSEIECVRAKPEPIIDRKVFPETDFSLEKNAEFPGLEKGIENVRFKNGDKLLIEHLGCENYTLVFRFETQRFSDDVENIGVWYKNAISLLEETVKGLNSPNLTVDGIKALKSHLKNTNAPKYEENIEFGGDEIRSSVTLQKVEKISEKTYEIEISLGVGPL